MAEINPSAETETTWPQRNKGICFAGISITHGTDKASSKTALNMAYTALPNSNLSPPYVVITLKRYPNTLMNRNLPYRLQSGHPRPTATGRNKYASDIDGSHSAAASED